MYRVSTWVRLVNFIADFLFIRFVLLRFIVVPVLQTVYPSLFTYPHTELVLLSYLINLIVLFVYYFAAEATTGMTVGKVVTQTKVVTIDGDKPTTRTFFFRTLWRIVPFEAFSWLGYAGWHDTQTNTMVVSRNFAQPEEEQYEEEVSETPES